MVSRPARRQNKANAKASKNPGSVRIISGLFKGKKLAVMDIDGLRPTTDRVKETVFNWLMFDVAGSTTLDCFAGSGSLAFEALSRGASDVTLIEKSPAAAKQLEKNLSSLKLAADTNTQVITTDSLQYLATSANKQFDLVFIDPPFRQNLVSQSCHLLVDKGWLAPDALIYLEYEKELNFVDLPSTWRLLKSQTAGQSSFHLYQHTA
ncbi:16S rRNA (guanine(966)-N(2))-methyltransferase RsmD [Catenovulum sp. SX2]|uniref:16S rRNA (guanine(966)-N(2))-methyltransferase RsmD n=1 Tax=Catenovulum sp. SX2 TaxID=3398614 RepID=UPI003F826E03